MVPSHFLALPEFPLTAQGKVDRRRLPAVRGAQRVEQPRMEQGAQAKEGTERRIEQLWQEALQLEYIPREANFFDLGGTSLKLIQVHEFVQRQWPGVPILAMFEHPTIASLAAHLDGYAGAGGSADDGAAQRRAALREEAQRRVRRLRRVRAQSGA